MKAFGDHYIYAGLGVTIGLSANTLSVAHIRERQLVMSVDDLRTYRVLFSRSHESAILASN